LAHERQFLSAKQFRRQQENLPATAQASAPAVLSSGRQSLQRGAAHKVLPEMLPEAE